MYIYIYIYIYICIQYYINNNSNTTNNGKYISVLGQRADADEGDGADVGPEVALDAAGEVRAGAPAEAVEPSGEGQRRAAQGRRGVDVRREDRRGKGLRHVGLARRRALAARVQQRDAVGRGQVRPLELVDGAGLTRDARAVLRQGVGADDCQASEVRGVVLRRVAVEVLVRAPITYYVL